MNFWLNNIAKNKNLRGEDFRVVFLLLSQVKDGSLEIYLSQSEIAKTLDIKPANACRSIRRLINQKIISKNIVAGKIISYELLL